MDIAPHSNLRGQTMQISRREKLAWRTEKFRMPRKWSVRGRMVGDEEEAQRRLRCEGLLSIFRLIFLPISPHTLIPLQQLWPFPCQNQRCLRETLCRIFFIPDLYCNLSSFRSQLKCHLLKEAFHDDAKVVPSTSTFIPLPYFYILLSFTTT